VESLSVNKRIRSLEADSIDRISFFLVKQQQKREADGASLKFLYQFNGISGSVEKDNCSHLNLISE